MPRNITVGWIISRGLAGNNFPQPQKAENTFYEKQLEVGAMWSTSHTFQDFKTLPPQRKSTFHWEFLEDHKPQFCRVRLDDFSCFFAHEGAQDRFDDTTYMNMVFTISYHIISYHIYHIISYISYLYIIIYIHTRPSTHFLLQKIGPQIWDLKFGRSRSRKTYIYRWGVGRLARKVVILSGA